MTPTISGWRTYLTVPTLIQRFLFVAAAVLLLAPPLPLPGTIGAAISMPATLRTPSGRRVLRLAGTPYQMGYQHGALLQADLRSLFCSHLYRGRDAEGEGEGEGEVPYLLLLAYARQVDPYLPTDLRQEIRGIADGAGLSYHDVLAWNLLESFFAVENRRDLIKDILFGRQWSLWPPVSGGQRVAQPLEQPGQDTTTMRKTAVVPFPCDEVPASPAIRLPPPGAGFSVWGNALADRELRLGKQIALDPAGPYGARPIIVMYHPSHGISFWSLTWPGYVGTIAGFNEAKMALYVTTLSSVDSTVEGVPAPFLARQALQYTVNEPTALTLLLSNRGTGGAVVVIGDGKVPHAQRLEMTAHYHDIQETDAGFLSDPPAFSPEGKLATMTAELETPSMFPWHTLRQQLLMGRNPETVAMQALQNHANANVAHLDILLNPAFQTATIQKGAHAKTTYSSLH